MDYLTNDTELTAVADAIREKAEITDLLEWPNGFIQAIEDCETGGPELEWLWGNQITNTMSGTIDSTDDAYAGPILNLGIDGVSTQITTTGKNLFNLQEYSYISGYFASEGDVIHFDNTRRVVYIPCVPNTTYVASRIAVQTAERFCIGYTNEMPATGVTVYGVYGAPTSVTAGQKISVSTTTGANATYLVLWAYWASSIQALDTLQIEAGSTATAYEPYTGGKPSPNPDYPQDILSVDDLSLALAGKNLLDVSHWLLRSGYSVPNVAVNDSNVSWTGATTGGRFIAFNARVMPNTTYTVSTGACTSVSQIYLHSKADEPTEALAINGYTGTIPQGGAYTFTTGADIRWIQIDLEVVTSSENGGVAYIQLELGSIATAYELYQGQTISLYDGTLRSLPDGTKDELHLTYLKPSDREGWAWYSREVVQRVSESQVTSFTRIYTDTDTRQGLLGTPRLHKTGTTYTGKVISNRFTYNYAAYNYGGPGTFNGDDTYVFEPSTFVDLAAANAWLAENPITVQYPLETSVTTTLDPIELPIMPSENATVWCDGGSAQPTFMLEYIQNANIVISRLEDSIADLATS